MKQIHSLLLLAICLFSLSIQHTSAVPFMGFSHHKAPRHDNLTLHLPRLSREELLAYNLVPNVHVKSQFMEGFNDLEAFGMIPIQRVVVSLKASDLVDDSSIPYMFQPVSIMTKSGSTMIQVQKNGTMVNQKLNPNEAIELMTNVGGRVNFAIPLVDESGRVQFSMPELLIKAPFHTEKEWVVVHPDLDFLHLVSNMDQAILASMVMELNPLLNENTAVAASTLFQELATASFVAKPSAYLQKRSYGCHNHQSKDLKTFLVDDIEYDSSRVLQQPDSPWVFEFQTQDQVASFRKDLPHLHKRAAHNGEIQPFEDFNTMSEVERTELSSSEGNHLVMTAKDKKGIASYFKLSNTKDASEALHHVFGSLGFKFKQLVHIIMSAISFDYDRALQTQKFLRHYIVTMTPMLKMALESQTRDQWYGYMSKSTDDWKYNAMKFSGKIFGSENTTLDAVYKVVEKGQKKSAARNGQDISQNGHLEDVRSLHFHDMYLENLHGLEFHEDDKENGNHIMGRLSAMGGELREKLMKTLGKDKMDHGIHKIVSEHLNGLSSPTPFAIISSVASIMDLLGKGITKLVAIVVWEYVPVMLHYLGHLYQLRIKIPIVRDLYIKFFSRASHDFTLLDMFSLIVGVTATSHYRAFFDGQYMFSKNDIDVLTTTQNPMLMLFNWMTDPRTMPAHSVAHPEYHRIKYERECILDWVIRIGMFIGTTISVGSTWIPRYFNYVFEHKRESKFYQNMWMQYGIAATQPIVAQIGGLSMFIAGTYVYPTDQVNSFEPGLLDVTVRSPDQTWFWWWTTWYVQVLLKVFDSTYNEPLRYRRLGKIRYRLELEGQLSEIVKKLDEISGGSREERIIFEARKNDLDDEISQISGYISKNSDLADDIGTYAWFYGVGVPQVYFVGRALGDMYLKLDWGNKERVAIAFTNTAAWFLDTWGYFLALPIKPFTNMVKDRTYWDYMTKNDIYMLGAYWARLSLMMKFKLYALSDFSYPAIKPAEAKFRTISGL